MKLLVFFLLIFSLIIIIESESGSSESSESSENNGFGAITIEDVQNLRTDIRNAIDDSTTPPDPAHGVVPLNVQPLLASIVRLVFHDCAGRNIKQDSSSSSSSSDSNDNNVELILSRCNGCIDLDFIDNLGLEELAFNPLEDIYYDDTNEWYKKMGRADFWAAAGTIALEYGAENMWNPVFSPFQFGIPSPLPDIPYYFGRTDCPNSPDAVLPDDVNDLFPSAEAGWPGTFAWFNSNFMFNERETVIILGAHTLGQTRPSVSGYINSWAGQPNVLNVEYYINIAETPVFPFIGIQGTSYIQIPVEQVVNCNNCTSDKVQWVLNNPAVFGAMGIDGRGMNLNSDISLAIKIEKHLDTETGVVTCTAPSFAEFVGGFISQTRCPRQDGILDIVNEFASNNSLWLNEFAQTWEKMVITRQDLLQLQRVIVPYNRSFEERELVNGPAFPGTGGPPPGVSGPPPGF